MRREGFEVVQPYPAYLPLSSEAQVHRVKSEGVRSCVAETVSVPESMVQEVVVNEQARAFLDTQYQFVLDPAFLQRVARLSSLRSIHSSPTQYQHAQLVPNSYGRALPLAGLEVAYGTPGKKMIARVMVGKGGGPSGSYYHRDADSPRDIIHSIDPIGFFGKNDAEQELLVTNQLIQAGFRATLMCGYIVIKPDQLKIYIERNFDLLRKEVDRRMISRIEEERNRMLQNIDLVLSTHHSQLVLSLRLSGTTERANLMYIAMLDQLNLREHNRLLGYFRYGAGVMADEVALNRQHIGAFDPDKAEQIFRTVSKGTNRLTQGQVHDYIELMSELTDQDIRAIDSVIDQKVLVPYLGNYSNAWFYVGAMEGKDTDFTFRHTDFEMIEINTEDEKQSEITVSREYARKGQMDYVKEIIHYASKQSQ